MQALLQQLNEHRKVIAEHAYLETGPAGWAAVWDEVVEMSEPLDALRLELQTVYCQVVSLIREANNGDRQP